MKRIIMVLLVSWLLVVIFYPIEVNAVSKLDYYREQAREIEKLDNLKVIDTSRLTYKIITHRKGKVIIERVIGRVKNNKGDGQVINQGRNTEYNYIYYGGWIDCKKGDIIVTYCLYNPENNADDDVIARWDYKLNK